jgi:hypothetical protein
VAIASSSLCAGKITERLQSTALSFKVEPSNYVLNQA